MGKGKRNRKNRIQGEKRPDGLTNKQLKIAQKEIQNQIKAADLNIAEILRLVFFGLCTKRLVLEKNV